LKNFTNINRIKLYPNPDIENRKDYFLIETYGHLLNDYEQRELFWKATVTTRLFQNGVSESISVELNYKL